MTDLDTESNRGEHAARLLSDPLLNEAFDTLQERFSDAWINSPSRDVEGREVLWLSQKLLTQIKSHLFSIVETGQMADIDLSRRGLR